MSVFDTIKKYVGAYIAALGGVDAVVFTGGIGENSRLVRRQVVEGMSAIGIAVDPAKNERNETDISAGPVKVLVVPTNEELAIARDTRRILKAMGAKAQAEAAAPAPPAPVEAGFAPAETARLVVLWAKGPKASAADLAGKLGAELGRAVTAEAVRRELERLSLVGAPGKAAAKAA